MRTISEKQKSAVVTTEAVTRNDYNLSPSRYVATKEQEPALPLEEALVLLAEAEEERREADEVLDAVLADLGLAGWRNNGWWPSAARPAPSPILGEGES
jgi:type I restriction enzyme M protein